MPSPEPVDGRCAAKIIKGGVHVGYCVKYPMRYQQRCGTHGARAPQAKAAAARRHQEAELEQAALTFGLRRDISPDDALLEQLQWTAGHVAWLLERVQKLAPEALVWGRTSEVARETSQFPGVDTTSEATPSVWLTLYERYQRHYMALIDLALKHRLDERRVRIAERDGARVAALLQGVLTELGHDPSDPSVMRIVSTRLQALAGGAA